MTKTTPLQIETLRAIEGGTVHMMKFGTAAFRIRGAAPSIVGRCVSLGLAKWPKGAIGEQTCEITDAGRAALASL